MADHVVLRPKENFGCCVIMVFVISDNLLHRFHVFCVYLQFQIIRQKKLQSRIKIMTNIMTLPVTGRLAILKNIIIGFKRYQNMRNIRGHLWKAL